MMCSRVFFYVLHTYRYYYSTITNRTIHRIPDERTTQENTNEKFPDNTEPHLTRLNRNDTNKAGIGS
jgi:hypothetical protein